MTEFIYNTGVKFYQQGRYEEALREFNKALLVEPGYQPAQEYVRRINQMTSAASAAPPAATYASSSSAVYPTPPAPSKPAYQNQAITDLKEIFGIEDEVVSTRKIPSVGSAVSAASAAGKTSMAKETVRNPKTGEVVRFAGVPRKIAPPIVIRLDRSLEDLTMPLEIEQEGAVILAGTGISRYLVTTPGVVDVQRQGQDTLLLTGKAIGVTYVHVWDANGRWTTEFVTVFPKIAGASYDELARREEDRARNFKLRYSLDWTQYEQGANMHRLRRQMYQWGHNLGLSGETPYGELDSSVSVRRFNLLTDLTYATIGLTNGKYGTLKGFNFRGLDYQTDFSNLMFPGITLRGVMLNSPAFHNRVNYTAFWGRDGGGAYGNLSPNLAKPKNSYLEGVNVSLSPDQVQNYKLSAVHAYGGDRDPALFRTGYDAIGSLNFERVGYSYETAYDTQHFANLLKSRYSRPTLLVTNELRDINRNYLSMTGTGERQGELGALTDVAWQPNEKFSMNSRLDLYQAHLYASNDHPNVPNEDFAWSAGYRFDRRTSGNLFYNLQNDLGRIAENRYQSIGSGVTHTFNLLNRDVYTYVTYYHQESDNFQSHSSDYINDRIYSGLRAKIIGEWYYYVTNEHNFLRPKAEDKLTQPHYWETGVDYQDRLGVWPLWANLRFMYHKEEDGLSTFSFLSGEDYIEGYLELTYRNNDTEVYGSWRTRNIWGAIPGVHKRMEMTFNAGMRYLWDTGLRWEAVGNIDGYVFKDLNSDGLRQRDEPPLQGVKVWLGKDKSQVTDIFGYYCFRGVRARSAYVSLDTTTIPTGYVVTVPVTQEVPIAHHRTQRADFGITTHSEISGYVFEDMDGNGDYGTGDKGLAGVVLTLENGRKAVTDSSGRYAFASIAPGEHTVTLALDSLPVIYLPKTSITRNLTLFEGMTYRYNIPLKRIKK